MDGKSCDDISFDTTDREEKRVTGGTDFSPSIGESAALCYEVNVLDFNNTNVFGTGVNHAGIQAVGAAGWMDLSFTESSATSVGGLPVIGFSATVRDSADASVNFGSSTQHSYVRAYSTACKTATMGLRKQAPYADQPPHVCGGFFMRARLGRWLLADNVNWASVHVGKSLARSHSRGSRGGMAVAQVQRVPARARNA